MLEKSQNIKYTFTYLEPSAARWIVDHHIKCVGMDTFSVEKYGSKTGLSYKILLSNSVGIIENLSSNLKNLGGKRVFLICLSLLLECVDGSPAKCLAELSIWTSNSFTCPWSSSYLHWTDGKLPLPILRRLMTSGIPTFADFAALQRSTKSDHKSTNH